MAVGTVSVKLDVVTEVNTFILTKNIVLFICIIFIFPEIDVQLSSLSEVDDSSVSTVISRMVESKQVRKHKLDRKRMAGKKQHKVIILGDSHARGCASEISHLLNNDFEVLGFVNPGTGMKHIKGTSRVKVQLLTKKDVVVLWVGGGALMTLRGVTRQRA